MFPVKIRPHLIPFLFKEMEGTEASYMNKTAKSIKISPVSSLGKFLYVQFLEKKIIGKRDRFIIYLTIETKKFNVYEGTLYISIRNIKEIIYLKEEQINEINNLIEDIFRISFIYFIDGFLSFSEKGNIKKAIDLFIDKYDLLEFGFSNESLRRLFYRDKEKGQKLCRVQFKSSNRVHNFHT